jgi:4-amino-4-deoxy-L-arabinose transferase-like glycosyltransferase
MSIRLLLTVGSVGERGRRAVGAGWETPESGRLSAFSQLHLNRFTATGPKLQPMTATSLREHTAPARSTPAPTSVPWWRTLSRPRPELLFLLLLAGVLNLWGLAQNGFANEYYSAAVRSMSSSWHAFLYGSFDAGGVMTVDKPPLSSWVQVAFVKVFGYHPLSMLVPQALMGVATVALVYDLTRRLWGRPAGFVAGLVLATTPIAVAISRHNNPDALLILCCAGALWATVRALLDGRTRWLVLAGVCVGLGFEAKMAAALLVVPGIVAAWLWVAPRGRLVALRQLLAGGAAMVAVGGAWPLLVALTPAADRPWVSGTSDNSILSLIFGYNGLGRLSGQAGGPQAFGGGAGGAGGGPFGGSPGVLRLLDSSLGGQAGWLLGFALVSGIGIAIASRLRRDDARTGWVIVVGGAALTCAVAFSAASGIFHPYYVSQLAPFAAALAGAGVGLMLKGGLRARILASLAIAGGVATTLVVLHNNAGQLTWLPPILVTAAVLAIGALALLGGRHLKTSLAVGLAALLIAPAAWAGQTLGHATDGTFPAGGPSSVAAGGFGGPGGAGGGFGGRLRGGRPGAPPAGAIPGTAGPNGATPGAGGRGGGGLGGRDSQAITAALAYIKQHGGGTLAVSSQNGGAATSIINSGADVVAIGGFSGRESQVTTDWLASRVESGAIRWVLTTGDGGGGRNDNRVGSSDVMTAVANTGRPVSSVSGLYDLAGTGAALGS